MRALVVFIVVVGLVGCFYFHKADSFVRFVWNETRTPRKYSNEFLWREFHGVIRAVDQFQKVKRLQKILHLPPATRLRISSDDRSSKPMKTRAGTSVSLIPLPAYLIVSPAGATD
jgi:hypothetical protein